jgi:thiamine-monophosphate kinase
MDVSDGLLLDATRMAAASGVTLAITSAAVPLAAPENRRAEALRWGDDYELLFTLPPDITPAAPAFRIGEVRNAGQNALLVDELPPHPGDKLGFQHS